MPVDADPSHWMVIDELWRAYTSNEVVALANADVWSLGSQSGTDLWTELDTWWSSYLDAQSVGLTSPTAHNLDESLWTDEWEQTDPWWSSYLDAQSVGLTSPTAHNLDESLWTIEWEQIDPWWNTYVDSQRQQLVTLHHVLDRMNEEWERSPSQFDRDPLTTDWTKGRQSHGPLRIKHEEDWSHWLAHLFRASSGAFTRRLLGSEFDLPPQSVRREVPFQNSDGANRRIDILVEYESSGVSIEVKRNDTNYGKTPETAALIDEQKHGTWTHVLLLPKHNSSRLRQQFNEQIVEAQDGPLTIVGQEYPDVLVLHWEMVSRALRETLLTGEEPDPHWSSSAYLFISLIEQHISSFEPVTAQNERIMSVEKTADVESLSTLQQLETVDVSEQIAHFERTLESHNE